MSGFDPITSGIWFMNNKNNSPKDDEVWKICLFWLVFCAFLMLCIMFIFE